MTATSAERGRVLMAYRGLREADPYTDAGTALAIARGAVEATDAGLPRWWAYDEGYPVEIEGRAYTLTLELDDPLNGHDWDCLGHVHWRGRDRDYVWPYCMSPVPPWPCVALPAGATGPCQGDYASETDTYYDPGPFWEPYNPPGMARGPAREWQRRALVAEGVRVRNQWTYGAVLTDDAGGGAALWGIDLADDGSPSDRAYLWHVAQELAAEIEHDREKAAEAERWQLGAALAAVSPHG